MIETALLESLDQSLDAIGSLWLLSSKVEGRKVWWVLAYNENHPFMDCYIKDPFTLTKQERDDTHCYLSYLLTSRQMLDLEEYLAKYHSEWNVTRREIHTPVQLGWEEIANGGGRGPATMWGKVRLYAEPNYSLSFGVVGVIAKDKT